MTGSPPMVLPSASASLRLGVLEVGGGEELAQEDRLAAGVRQLDADGVAAGDDGDARGDGAHRAGDVVGEADDARRLDAGRRLQLVERDDRAGADVDDLAAHAEILEHAFEQACVLLERAVVDLRCRASSACGSARKLERRQLELFGDGREAGAPLPARAAGFGLAAGGCTRGFCGRPRGAPERLPRRRVELEIVVLAVDGVRLHRGRSSGSRRPALRLRRFIALPSEALGAADAPAADRRG